MAPKIGKIGSRFLDHLASAYQNANPELMRLALKLVTGAGKTTVMAMLLAWQTVNARKPTSKNFTRRFLIVTPGLTIRDRLRVRQWPKEHFGAQRRSASLLPRKAQSCR